MQQYFLLFVFLIFYEVKSINNREYDVKVLKKNDEVLRNVITKRYPEIKCKNNEDCSIYFENLECKEGVCKCADSSMLSSDGSKCLKLALEYGSSCEDNIQCSNILSAGGSCINNECRCKPGYHYLKGSCRKSRGLGERCIEEGQCFSTYEYRGLECKNQTCQCKKEYYERFKSGCRRIRKGGESCNIDSDCPDNYICNKMLCSSNSTVETPSPSHSPAETGFPKKKTLICSQGTFKLKGNCVLELGMPCTSHNDCSHINKASCEENICTCQVVTHVPKENNRECLTVARGKIQEITKSSCKENVQCGVFGANSFCNERKCNCANGTYFNVEDQFCWPLKSLGEQCFSNKDCNSARTNAECKIGDEIKVCVCKQGYHQVGDTCLPDAWNVGDSCKTNESCLFNHSYCNMTTQTCDCMPNYYEEEKKCKPGVGSYCATDKDCFHLNNTVCNSNHCQCKALYAGDDKFKYCLLGAKYNENCTESFQCRFYLEEYGECVNRICQCAENSHYSNNKCYKTKHVNEKCVSQSECAPGNDPNSVLCFKGICTCNFDFTINEHQICVPSKSAPPEKIHPLLLIISFVIFFK